MSSPAAPAAVLTTDLPLSHRRQGKVRDVYETTFRGQPAMVIVATDRISAFDVVMPTPIPGKGIILTQLSGFWFEMIARQLGDRVQHHVLSTDPADIAGLSDEQRRMLRGRVTLGRKAKVVPIECVARGYLAGSGWKEYQQIGSVCGVHLPPGLRQCDRLPEPIFTPATKADEGHDENISFDHACERVGRELMTTLRELTLAIYRMAHDYAADRGIILADTKFEFGHAADGKLLLIDEVLTPDSSRFWPADQYEPGRDQYSYDKQYVRNHLQELYDKGLWDKTPPGPALPADVVDNTLRRYAEAFERLTGQAWSAEACGIAPASAR